MGALDKNDQIARLNKTRGHYHLPRRLFMKFLVWAAYNAYIIMDSYRPRSRAGHHFRTFHMFVDELCLQLVGDYRTAVHRHEARAQQSDLLRLQGVVQHHPERSPAATGNNLCMGNFTLFTAGQGTCLAASVGPRTTPSFTTTRVGGGNGPGNFTHSGPGHLPGRPPMITLDTALSLPSHVFVNFL